MTILTAFRSASVCGYLDGNAEMQSTGRSKHTTTDSRSHKA